MSVIKITVLFVGRLYCNKMTEVHGSSFSTYVHYHALQTLFQYTTSHTRKLFLIYTDEQALIKEDEWLDCAMNAQNDNLKPQCYKTKTQPNHCSFMYNGTRVWYE
jgi:hypothetical protein